MLISDRLAHDMAQILELVLTQDRFNENELTIFLLLLLGRSSSKTRKVQKDLDDHEWDDSAMENKGLSFKTTLPPVNAFQFSNPYINALLFCDYYAQDSVFERVMLPGYGELDIHVEASRYVSDVLLLRTLDLARVNGSKPTNLHVLLQRLCQLSLAEGLWQLTQIYRCKQSVKHCAAWFTRVANRLERIQKTKSMTVINETARNQREQSGSYWLVAGDCKAEVVEELCLLDVFRIIPLALKPGFSKDGEFFQCFKSIINSLNTRYRWLRSCGLTPENWLNRKQPSINELKQLAALRTAASATGHWKRSRYEQAYQTAFLELKKMTVSVGGFADFDLWLQSDVGQAMLSRNQHLLFNLDDLLDDSKSDTAAFEPTDSKPDTYELLQAILMDAGELLSQDPVLQEFISQVLLENRNVVDKDGLFEDSRFKKLVAQHENYAKLDTGQLAETLYFKTQSLIFEVLLETGSHPISAALLTYIRVVIIEQHPAQGEGGLLNRRSFKKLRAGDPELNALTPKEIHDLALKYLSRLLDNL